MADNTQKSVLASFYHDWEEHQDKIIAALQPLTAQQLTLRAAPNLRSVHEIVLHVIGARVRWFHGALGEGDADIAALGQWDRPGQPTRTAQELVNGLQQSWHLMKAALDRWTPDEMAQEVKSMRHGQEESFNRQGVVWHVLEHDLHHGGEFSLTLGLHGLTAPDM